MGGRKFFDIMGAGCPWIIFVLIVHPAPASAETSYQSWLSITRSHQKGPRFYMEVEIQPKTQISGGEHWRNIDATWEAEYYPNPWIDLTAELVTG